MEKTIAAIATATGKAGIGIIRISGERSLPIIEKLFRPANSRVWAEKPSHRLIPGNIYSGSSLLDQGMVVYMPGPGSFTGEDVVEIHAHGGFFVLERILEAVIQEGAETAQPGEFSKRAFLNGKLDLVQAEAIIDIIEATSDSGLELAAKHLQGTLSDEIDGLRNRLFRLLSHLEASLDFPEDEIEPLPAEEMDRIVEEALKSVEELISSYHHGKLARNGIKTVIAGKPNVGKSSLLNSLLKENRAIVTEVPGTTRDTIEELLNMEGLLLRIIDTAGIRKTHDQVEKIGVDRSKSSIQEADLVILLLDTTTGMTDEDREIEKELQNWGKTYLKVWNKQDLKDIEIFSDEIAISAKEKDGFARLSRMIRQKVDLDFSRINQKTVTRHRHYQLLEHCREYLKNYQEGRKAGMPEDFLSIDLRGAWEKLNELTGKQVADDIFDQIFAEFCIGK